MYIEMLFVILLQIMSNTPGLKSNFFFLLSTKNEFEQYSYLKIDFEIVLCAINSDYLQHSLIVAALVLTLNQLVQHLKVFSIF